MEEIKKKLYDNVINHFPEIKGKNDFIYNRIDFEIEKGKIPAFLRYFKDDLGYNHLSHATCIDWIEDEKFELIFILWSYTEKIKVFIHTFLDRNNPVMDNMDTIWRQLNTYEREFREMFGIQFEGLIAPDEFILEDWHDIPPFRKDFDTAAYAKKTYFERPGREDAKDVRETISTRSGEEIPEFAKKYSR